jgi:calcineurin-like phosphoesterase family protein
MNIHSLKYNNLYFTSDLHLKHAKILEYDSRLFASIEEHDQALIDGIKCTVKPDDLLFILGDITLSKDLEYLNSLFNQISHIRKVLIIGNHDKHLLHTSFIKDHFLASFDYLEFKHAKKLIVMSHYPIYSWNRSHHSSLHVYGHTHTHKPVLGNKAFNVGVCNSKTYTPFSYEEICTDVFG